MGIVARKQGEGRKLTGPTPDDGIHIWLVGDSLCAVVSGHSYSLLWTEVLHLHGSSGSKLDLSSMCFSACESLTQEVKDSNQHPSFICDIGVGIVVSSLFKCCQITDEFKKVIIAINTWTISGTSSTRLFMHWEVWLAKPNPSPKWAGSKGATWSWCNPALPYAWQVILLFNTCN